MGRKKEPGCTLLKKNSLLLKPAMALPRRVHPLMLIQGQCVSVFFHCVYPRHYTVFLSNSLLVYTHPMQRVHDSSSSNVNLHY